MRLIDAPIRQKLMTIILSTSGAVLLLTCTAFFAYEFLTFRQEAARQLTTLGQVIATNTTAALAFDNQDDAAEVLRALTAERHIVAAALYDKSGRIFAKFPANVTAGVVPSTPEADGHRFEHGHLVSVQPVIQSGNNRLGAIYLESDMGAMYDRFRLYGVIVGFVIIGSFLLAYAMSRMLEGRVSQPILALAETAKAIADRQDYSVRATKLGEDEIGLLT